MGSHYFGDPNCSRNERAAGISSSSSSSALRKSKKGSSEKPKQPQRGLGVAQLEKIRLHSQLGCNYFPASNFGHQLQEDVRTHTAYSSALTYPPSDSLPSYDYQGPGHHGVVMGLLDLNRTNAAYGDSQLSSVARWLPGNAPYEQHIVEPRITRPFFKSEIQASLSDNNKTNDRDLMALSNHKPESKPNSSQELDLELRLSL